MQNLAFPFWNSLAFVNIYYVMLTWEKRPGSPCMASDEKLDKCLGTRLALPNNRLYKSSKHVLHSTSRIIQKKHVHICRFVPTYQYNKLAYIIRKIIFTLLTNLPQFDGLRLLRIIYSWKTDIPHVRTSHSLSVSRSFSGFLFLGVQVIPLPCSACNVQHRWGQWSWKTV